MEQRMKNILFTLLIFVSAIFSQDLHKYSTQEVMNIVLDDPATSVDLHYYSTQEAFNIALDETNSALKANVDGLAIDVNDNLIVDGLLVLDPTSLSTEVLAEEDFATHATWSVTNDFDDTGGNAAYVWTANQTSTLTQLAASFSTAPLDDRWYRFDYTVVVNTAFDGDGAMQFNSALFDSPVALSLEAGTHTYYFRTDNITQAFVIQIISGTDTEGSYTLDDFTLKEITDGQVDIAGKLFVDGIDIGAAVAPGAIGLADLDTDLNDIIGNTSGLAFDKPSMTIVDDGGLQLDVAEVVGGGNMRFLIAGVVSTLDCVTGAGVGGDARVALTAGADENNPVTNYIYVTDAAGTATLAASTSLPTGAFAWIGKVIVPDATTWASTGAYGFQRYTEMFENDSRGTQSHAREKLRVLGAVYLSGITQTLNITANGGAVDNVHLATGAGVVYQLHRQAFPAFTIGDYYYGNGTTPYTAISDLSTALMKADGTAITNNKRFNLVIWGAVNISSGECKLYVNLPNGVYNTDNAAKADRNNTADYTVPNDLRSVAFMISRVALKYTSAASGTWTELGVYSLLGTPAGARSGGAGAVASNEFDDSQFRVYGSVDATKELALEVDGITASTTRTLTFPDWDINFGTPLFTTVEVADEIFHSGDTDTKILLGGDNIQYEAGGIEMVKFTEATQNTVVFNDDQADNDFRIETDTDQYGFFLRGSDGYIGFGLDTPINSEFMTIDGDARVTGVLKLTERAAQVATIATEGEFWVESAAPNIPMYTDDDGDDHNILTSPNNTMDLYTIDRLHIDSTPDTDETASGVIIELTAGEVLNVGDVCYQNADGEIYLADATDATKAPALFMCIETGADGVASDFLMTGVIRDDTWNWTVGGLIYLTITGTTGNTLSQTAPAVAGEQVQVIGMATNVDRMTFTPSLVLVEI